MQEKHLFRLALVTSIVGIICLYFVSSTLYLQLEGPFLINNVVDGDTVDLETGERIRLSGINAPESGECGYDKATEALTALVLGKEVYLERDIDDTGKYGRELRYIYVEDFFVNGYLVEEGFVKVYDKYNATTKKYGELKVLELEAITEEKGVWSCVDPKEGCMFVASKNSNIYHEPHCKWAKKIKEENLLCFHSLEETEGFEPASSC